MEFTHRLKRPVSVVLAIFIMLLGLQTSVVRAAMISTESEIQSAQHQYDRDQLLQLTQSDEARDILLSMGVAPEDVEDRVNNMTSEELAEFNQQIDEMPAGAGVLGLVVLIFVILIVLDLLGTTNIFPVIKPIN
ncbi:PA2779 family protein [Hahella ganghwensis]|uniref:PA2779 family protein n=1 Tax=Hahella ganghwensis TaxID=286420 RepID=UPI00036CF889|nr:PA2779 family protein [Hahella ganghwensis]